MSTPVQLSGPLIEAFAGTFLSPRYDDAMPTPQFHREAWDLYASEQQSAGIIAPRDHAKSTALTFDYILASVCFRIADYVLLISSTEEKAAEQLSNISEELHENTDLREEFGIVDFESDQKTEIIVVCDDGHRFRIVARGAEQKIRGALWKGKRPNLIVCDDMEDDEQVESRDRRRKFRRWFFRAAKQALSQSGKIRVHGTVLHEDSLLARLRKNKTWKFLFYKAHNGYDDFTGILWPERWSEEKLRAKRSELEEDGDPGGYAQEYLNDPQDLADAYLLKEQFIPMSEEDYDKEKLFYVGCDFAVSKADAANRTSFTVGGVSLDNLLHMVDEHVGRWDTLEWVNMLFDIVAIHSPQIVFVEGGVIWNGIWPIIRREMQDRDIYINFEVLNPVKDKAIRGRSWQKRMKAGVCRFDVGAEWFEGYRDECLRFTGTAQAKLDDQFDSTATLCMGLDRLSPMEEEDLAEEREDDELEVEESQYYLESGEGRNASTGY